jgi:hypothetical protein
LLTILLTPLPLLQSDPELLAALDELRFGDKLSDATRMLVSELQRPLPDDGIQATHLFPRREEVCALTFVCAHTAGLADCSACTCRCAHTPPQAKTLNSAAFAWLPGPVLQFPAIDRRVT